MSHPELPALHPLGDRAVVVQVGERINDDTFERVQALSHAVSAAQIRGVTEHVPAYTTVTLYYDPQQTSLEALGRDLQELLALGQLALAQQKPLIPKTVEIPVCYGGEFGSDLEHVAQHTGLTSEQVIAIHSQGIYRVHMLGFAPGFPYLGGMSERIATPRRRTPRLKVPAGSVGIAGAQTGIYSLETPGGWQIIGHTPLALFRPADDPPTLLAPGDTVRFRPITNEEFTALQEADA